MAMKPSVTVVEVGGDDDDEWGEEEEVVVWSNGVDMATAGHGDSFHHHHSNGSSVDNAGAGRDQGGHPRGLLIASLANLAISYNVVNVGLALKIMAKTNPSESTTDESVVSSAIILGMMTGQLVFGALGDWLGRQLALCCTLLVCFAGAAGSSVLTFDGGVGGADIFRQLLYWRVLLGIGAGGVYPLAATLARASSLSSTGWCSRLKGGGGGGGGVGGEDTGSTSVALMFSMQGVGYLAAHATGFALLCALPEDSPLAWRLLLGLGAILPLVLVVALALAFARARRYRLVQSAVRGIDDDEEEDEEEAMGAGGGRGGGRGGDDGASSPARFWLSMRNKRQLLRALVGTAGSWFLFDVTFYGNQLYEDDVLEAVFGGAETLRDEASQDIFLALVALPGYFVAVALVAKMGPRRVQVQGFLAMAVLFAVIGLCFRYLRRHAGMLMLLYSLTFFFSNFGPNSTTFMLPSLTFPDQVRGSFNGISAAAGKFGALQGSLMFKPAAEAWGVGLVLVICALISLAGGILTVAFVDSGEQQPILVGGGDSDDESFDDRGVVAMRELEMTGRAAGRGGTAVANGRPSPAGGKNGQGRTAAAASQNGLPKKGEDANGAIPMPPLGRRERSSGPSREHSNSPIKPKRKGKAGGMGVYARVTGDGGLDAERWDSGSLGFQENSGSREYQEDDFLGGSREGNGGGFGNGSGLGRTGEVEVEGQMETGWARSSWDGDSHSSGDSDAGARSELVEPA